MIVLEKGEHAGIGHIKFTEYEGGEYAGIRNWTDQDWDQKILALKKWENEGEMCKCVMKWMHVLAVEEDETMSWTYYM